LLDTHALLWFALDDARLSKSAASLIIDAANEKYVSPASYWEIAIKIGANKYTLSQPYETFMRAAIDMNGFRYLHIEPRHTARLTTLPHRHRDPFDRLLIAQAEVENMSIVRVDPQFDGYGVLRLW
jgi:PIN domain nuclease of toxin-antitoxin system